MNNERLSAKMTAQTPNLMSSGGSAHDVLTAGDIQAVFMSCEATPLIIEFYTAKYQIGANQFEFLLKPWMFNRIVNEQHRKEAIDLDYLAKNHGSHITAASELAEGLCKYLTRHKVSRDTFGSYFDMHKSTFSRKYRAFIKGCADDLEAELYQLERELVEKTQNV